MRVVVEPTPATAVLLRVTGPAGIGLVGDRTDLLVEALQSSAQVVLAAFGASVTGPVARVTGVEVGEAGAISVQVVDAVGADHRSLPVGVVTARIVVDTVQ